MADKGPPYNSLRTYVQFKERDYIQKHPGQCKPGESILLKREKTGFKDENAIQVFDSNSCMLGYISPEIAKIIAPLMDADRSVTAKVSEINKIGGQYHCLIEITVNGVKWGAYKNPIFKNNFG